jgi:deazaflavin-dependent oxidoreductase (nitroreductase family)
MPKVVRIVAASAALAGILGGAVLVWRRNPRLGTTFVNSVVNPMLVRRGLAGGEGSEIGTLEHVGRRSGIRRLTPVHPEVTPEGFRILVPLGPHSEWARNVLAAGHCRVQLHDLVYELDEPTLVPTSKVEGLPRPVRAVMASLGFAYLELHSFAVGSGSLEPAETGASMALHSGLVEQASADRAGELVASSS